MAIFSYCYTFTEQEMNTIHKKNTKIYDFICISRIFLLLLRAF